MDTTTRKLNLKGRQNLKKAIQTYFENNNSMNKLNDEIDKTKQIIIDGINIMVENIEKLEDLEVKSKILLENAKYLKKMLKLLINMLGGLIVNGILF